MERHLTPLARRAVLGGAFLAATLLAFLPDSAPVRAAETHADRPALVAQTDAKAAADAAREAAREATAAAREAAAAAKDAAREARRKTAEADSADTATDEPGGRHRKGIVIGIGPDREYDSFDQFLDRDPGLAAAVMGIVFIVFLTPVLMIALIVWYKMRKNRMQNETMLKLAEKGIVPPADAMQAIGTGRAEAAIGMAAATAPLAEQARAIRKAAAWSDLRKGVLLGAVGFALTFYSLLDDATANWFGLVLLFVGIGYCTLWYFEDRQAAAAGAGVPVRPPAPGPGDPQN